MRPWNWGIVKLIRNLWMLTRVDLYDWMGAIETAMAGTEEELEDFAVWLHAVEDCMHESGICTHVKPVEEPQQPEPQKGEWR